MSWDVKLPITHRGRAGGKFAGGWRRTTILSWYFLNRVSMRSLTLSTALYKFCPTSENDHGHLRHFHDDLYLGSFLLFLRHNVEFDDAGKELAKFPARFFDVFTGGIGYFFVTGG